MQRNKLHQYIRQTEELHSIHPSVNLSPLKRNIGQRQLGVGDNTESLKPSNPSTTSKLTNRRFIRRRVRPLLLINSLSMPKKPPCPVRDPPRTLRSFLSRPITVPHNLNQIMLHTVTLGPGRRSAQRSQIPSHRISPMSKDASLYRRIPATKLRPLSCKLLRKQLKKTGALSII